MPPGHTSRPLLCIDRAENLAAFRSGSMLQAQGRALPRSARPVGPLSAAPSQYRARIFGGLVARLSRVPVVGPNFDPAPQRVTHKFFFYVVCNFSRPFLCIAPRFNRARRFGAG